MNSPWNKSVTIKWTYLNQMDATTYPPSGMDVLVIGYSGDIRVAKFDGRSHDFLLSISPLEQRDVIECHASIVAELAEDMNEDVDDDLFYSYVERIDNSRFEPIYLDAKAWCLIPPAPQLPGLLAEKQLDHHSVTVLTYDILSSIEPALRHAITSAMEESA
jgi:hypothetical protein